jgi:hypothetical protein
MAKEEVTGPRIKRKSGVGAPKETVDYVTPPAARKNGKGNPTPPVSPKLRKFGGPK